MDDDDYLEPTDKFDECFSCKNNLKFKLCRMCDVGEFFEEKDIEDLRDLFK